MPIGELHASWEGAWPPVGTHVVGCLLLLLLLLLLLWWWEEATAAAATV